MIFLYFMIIGKPRYVWLENQIMFHICYEEELLRNYYEIILWDHFMLHWSKFVFMSWNINDSCIYCICAISKTVSRLSKTFIKRHGKNRTLSKNYYKFTIISEIVNDDSEVKVKYEKTKIAWTTWEERIHFITFLLFIDS